MSYAFIQSCSSAVGAQLTRQLLQRTQLSVVGSSRNPKAAKEAILSGGGLDESRLTVLEMDTLEEGTIEKAAKEVKERFGEHELKLLLNASGVLHAEKSFTKVNAKNALHSFQVNTIGHLLTFKHFLPLLPTANSLRHSDSAKKDLTDGLLPPGLSLLASLTARVGSIGDNQRGGWVSYRASKAATNQVIQTLQRELEAKKAPAIAVALHPGTVVGTPLSKDFTREKDLGNKEGNFTPEQSAQHLLEVISKLKEGSGGSFHAWDGEIKW